MFEDRVVLDSDDNPIKLWPELPLLCSSKMSGAELEAISRTNPEIPLSAIRARMPWPFKGGNLCAPPELNALRMRMRRFRNNAGLIAWNKREGSRQIKEELFKILGSKCIHENSTRSFGRDLTKEEVDKVLGVNEGTAPQRSRRKKRSAESEEGPIAPNLKRQKNTLSSFAQEQFYGQAGPSVRTSSEGQENNPKLGGFPKPKPQGQTRAHTQPNLNESDDGYEFLPAKRLYAEPKNHHGDPQIQRSRGGSEHRLCGRPSDVLSSLPSLGAQGHTRKRERHWAEEDSDDETDGEDLAPPMKRPYSSRIPPRSNQAMGSPATVARRTSGTKHLSSAPTHRRANDNILFKGSQLRRHFAEHKTTISLSQPPIHTSSMATPGKEERIYKRASSHQGEAVHPTPSLQTVKTVPREASGNHTQSKAQQTNSYVSHKASGDIIQPFRSEMPTNVLGPQALQPNELASALGLGDSIEPLGTSSAPSAKTIVTPQTDTALMSDIFGADIVLTGTRQLANNP